jgi:glycosyltransferase involved in cell wall biosynthesis
MVLTLRTMGYDAWLVALGDETTDTAGRPVLAVKRAELDRPEWWQTQRPDAVVLSTGSGPRYDAVRKAALSATPRVVERLDTDGVRSARLFPGPYLTRTVGALVDKGTGYGRAVLTAAARSAVLYLFPQLLDVRMVETMRQLPALMAESPMALERIQKMFETFAGTKHRIAMIPHPVNETTLHFDGAEKINQVITVGRWESFQKDYPMVRRILQEFLQRHPDWKAVVVGSGVPPADSHPSTNAGEWLSRVTFHDKLGHDELASEYNRSKIYLMASRYESFCIAAAEALCCGCSVVGSSDVPTSFYFAEMQSGRVASPRSLPAFLAAMEGEAGRWAAGERDPKSIASIYRQRTGAHAVCAATISLLEEIAPEKVSPV